VTTATRTLSSVLDHLIDALRRAGVYNRNDQRPPVVVLWTDEERLWESVLPMVRRRLPILTFGAYSPENVQGPACWVRCALAGLIGEFDVPDDVTPVLYVPGYSRFDLRTVEACPTELQSLAELQFRGAWFTQSSGKDWTPYAFLRNVEQGIGIEVAADAATADALHTCLTHLLDQPVGELRTLAPLKADDLLKLVSPDAVGSILRWMDDPDSFRARQGDAWSAFRSQSRKQLNFDPEADTGLGAAERLATRAGGWAQVWRRFTDAPANYPEVPKLLQGVHRKDLFASQRSEVWPQDNEDAEDELRSSLSALAGRPDADIRAALAHLESDHGVRREWVWATLGHSPLASSLEHLVALSDLTAVPIVGDTVAQMVSAYASAGWQADDSLLRALEAVERAEDEIALHAVADALYRRWAEQNAIRLVEAIDAESLPQPVSRAVSPGTCLLFSDGLRFDLGRRLEVELRRRRLSVELDAEVAAIPTVTATAKPAASPVASRFIAGEQLGTRVAESGASVTAEVFRKILVEEGFQVLAPTDTGDPSGRGWTELGDIDALGHAQDVKLPRYVDAEIRSIADRVATLLKAGWTRVEVLTDHGWILLPGGLAKVELPDYLTVTRKGRCARIKADAQIDVPRVPWAWDPNVRVAVAPGVTAFVKGKEYEHGGVSLQECIVPRIVVQLSTSREAVVSIESVRWVGLRCRVHAVGAPSDAVVDLRTRPADPDSSLANRAASVDEGGNASLVVANDEDEQSAAVVVVLGADGTVLGQRPTVVGVSG
jgi:hypothetical protein